MQRSRRTAEESRQRRRRRITEGPVGSALFRLAAPMSVGIVAVMAFNLADTFFVARLGTLELAAISFTFPVVAFIGSVVMGLGVGVTSVLSGEVGAGRDRRVRALARDALILAVAVVALLSALGLATIDPLFTALGADERTLPLVREYMTIWYLGMVFLVIPMIGNGAIRATGDTTTPAAVMVVAALGNVILDPILIFGLGPFPALGLAGAAVASVASRALTLLVALWVLLGREHMVELAFPDLRGLLERWRQILHVGAPAAGAQVLGPLAMGVVTRLVALYGAAAVAGFGAGTRIRMVAMIVPMALATGMTPFAGQNSGAERMDRVHRAVRLALRFDLAGGVVVYALLALLAWPAARLFTPDPEVQEVIVAFVRISMTVLALDVLVHLAVATFNGLRRPARAATAQVLYLLGFIVPATLLGSWLYDLHGVFAGLAVGSALAGLVAWRWLLAIGGEHAGAPTGGGAQRR